LFQQLQFVDEVTQASVSLLKSPITLLHLFTSVFSLVGSEKLQASAIILSHMVIFLKIFAPSIAFDSLYLPAQIGELFESAFMPPKDPDRRSKLAFVVLLLFPFLPANFNRASILFFCCMKF